MKEKFSLKHVVLYSKGWYKRDNIWKDLQILLDADGFNTMWQDKPYINDIVRIVIDQCTRLEVRAFDTFEFFEGVKDKNVWKNGYTTKTNIDRKLLEGEILPDYDVNEAAMRYCLSNLCCRERSKFPELCRPDFNILPRGREDLTDERIEEVFGHLPLNK